MREGKTMQDPQLESTAIVLNFTLRLIPAAILTLYMLSGPQSHTQFSDGLRAPRLWIIDVPTAPKP